MGKLVTAERIFETSVTTGAGEYTLAGAQVGFQPVSVIGANNYGPFYVTDDVNWEALWGTYIAGPSRLQRTAIKASSNGGAAVNWGAGTKKIRQGWPAFLSGQQTISKSVAGGVDVTLTIDEQRRKILTFTGALTANINVIVDDTPWDWIMYNNTSGAFTLTVKTAAGTGKAIAQGKRMAIYCDGTNVELATDDFSPINNLFGSFGLSGDVSPAQIIANQNDYNPPGGSGAAIWRLSTDASRDITGMAGGADGAIRGWHNVGGFNIVVKDENAGSTAANRFALTSDLTLAPDACAIFQYDATSSRWRLLASGAAAAASGLSSKRINATRDISLASGTQDITSVGFNPTAAIIFAVIDGTQQISWGFADSGGLNSGMADTAGGGVYADIGTSGLSVRFRLSSSGNIYDGVMSFITDGGRITWTKTGTPTGTANLDIFFLK